MLRRTIATPRLTNGMKIAFQQPTAMETTRSTPCSVMVESDSANEQPRVGAPPRLGFLMVRGIAFVSNRDGDPNIYVMNAHEWCVTKLMFGFRVLDENPTYSPHPSKIAFDSDRAGHQSESSSWKYEPHQPNQPKQQRDEVSTQLRAQRLCHRLHQR